MAKRVFEDITLTWKGAKYVVPSQHVMRAIARIEDHITLQELMEGMSQRRPKFSKIASAFASVLRFAGCAVEDEEVYDGLLSGADEESPEGISVIAQALTGLLNMMMPPKSMQKLSAVEVGKKGESRRRSPSPKAAANSSLKPTKLATAGD
jgi:hypothetical protein